MDAHLWGLAPVLGVKYLLLLVPLRRRRGGHSATGLRLTTRSPVVKELSCIQLPDLPETSKDRPWRGCPRDQKIFHAPLSTWCISPPRVWFRTRAAPRAWVACSWAGPPFFLSLSLCAHAPPSVLECRFPKLTSSICPRIRYGEGLLRFQSLRHVMHLLSDLMEPF